jgi:hypothetical protein
MQVTRLIQLFRELEKLSTEMRSAPKGRQLQDKNRLREIRLEIRVLAGSFENARKLVKEKRQKDQEEGLRASEIEAERQRRIDEYLKLHKRLPRMPHCYNCKKALIGFDEHLCSECGMIRCACGACRCNAGKSLYPFIGAA